MTVAEKIEALEKKIAPEMQKKHWNEFERISSFLGNSIYGITEMGLYSNSPRELFLMLCARNEGIKLEES